jgi:cell shape-determining protein MreD
MSLPLTLLLLIVLSLVVSPRLLFLLAFVFGILLDTLLIREIGQTSLFFVVVCWFLFMNERTFVRVTYPFVLFISISSVFFYLVVYGSQNALLTIILSVIIVLLLFMFFSRRQSVMTPYEVKKY